jgi:hypothetical protein
MKIDNQVAQTLDVDDLESLAEDMTEYAQEYLVPGVIALLQMGIDGEKVLRCALASSMAFGYKYAWKELENAGG